jgi:hypothetical protein
MVYGLFNSRFIIKKNSTRVWPYSGWWPTRSLNRPLTQQHSYIGATSLALWRRRPLNVLVRLIREKAAHVPGNSFSGIIFNGASHSVASFRGGPSTQNLCKGGGDLEKGRWGIGRVGGILFLYACEHFWI